eukprot:snap_masked-scaffold_9-processed-gene-6.15-mRNA-1 protein AED:1.00 eAED:1.00 QI:0/0/0/0/1/1/2/0/104
MTDSSLLLVETPTSKLDFAVINLAVLYLPKRQSFPDSIEKKVKYREPHIFFHQVSKKVNENQFFRKMTFSLLKSFRDKPPSLTLRGIAELFNPPSQRIPTFASN